MIDEKKIEEAARQRVNAFRKANPDGYSTIIVDIESDCMDNFKAGVNWALQEFKKSLWHDASEEPERYDDYFVKTKQGSMGVYYFDADGWLEPMAGKGNVMMWLDLKDILPKKGGGQ